MAIKDKGRKRSATERRLNDLSGKEWIKRCISWFTIKTRPRTKSQIKHPGKFPEELCDRFVTLFTKPGQWVIDPFAGVGSTLVSCRTNYRNSVGIELNTEFAETARQLLIADASVIDSDIGQDTPTCTHTLLNGDALLLDELLSAEFTEDIPQFALCMTSPPYWNMLGKHRGGSDSQHRTRKQKGLKLVYSEGDEADLANTTDYGVYLDKLIDVFAKLRPFMKPGGHLVVIMQNIRDSNGEFVPLAWDFCGRMKDLFDVKQEQIWCQTDKKAGIWGFPTTYVSSVHHHYCLIFRQRS